MNQKTNYHTHTPLCKHASGLNAAEYAKAAYDAGLTVLVFSDHAPFKDHDFGYRMDTFCPVGSSLECPSSLTRM